jgi:hypothetical protein
MTVQKITLSVVAMVASLVLTGAARADTHIAVAGFGGAIVTPHAGIGVWVGPSAPERHVYHAPVYREHREYGPPWRHRFVRMGPPPVVIVRPPVPVVVKPAPPVVLDSTVTVWITNSNGSQTTVPLTRHNGWYIGPRGEYYDQMPTNEQLRLAYGF